ncbi:uncharacterized protein LOC108910040 isoform X1 [Anoplophora glabripennis]|uniref:uncharacterized protein LOC108910040 isoform X2 n=1 Tax=Anoplophora glabripennis TaxID=217634 RepID=UPI000874928B|nr:uncharacterized protein LOC108910040 isoform X2 [Anoplophora glabripennis]XP_023310367.1 uncharacterized protein LOC108910040 isoform X1 [Anoplophora glabripennis]
MVDGSCGICINYCKLTDACCLCSHQERINMKILVFVFVISVFFSCNCEDLHLIEPKRGQCFDIYPEGKPIYLSRSLKTCTENIPEINNCLGLRTQNGEIINLDCNEDEQENPGCYQIINADQTKGTVCQKMDQARGCEVISTPTGVNVEVFCYPVEESRNIIYVKSLKLKPT